MRTPRLAVAAGLTAALALSMAPLAAAAATNYCEQHKDACVPPNAMITVDPATDAFASNHGCAPALIYLGCVGNAQTVVCCGPPQPGAPSGNTNAAGTATGNTNSVPVSKAAAIPPLKNPLGTTSVPILIGRVVNAVLGISGSLALVMVVYGGFLWITSGGSPERIKQGKEAMVWAAIGIVFIFGAYAVLNYVLQVFKV